MNKMIVFVYMDGTVQKSRVLRFPTGVGAAYGSQKALIMQYAEKPNLRNVMVFKNGERISNSWMTESKLANVAYVEEMIKEC